MESDKGINVSNKLLVGQFRTNQIGNFILNYFHGSVFNSKISAISSKFLDQQITSSIAHTLLQSANVWHQYRLRCLYDEI